jgi:hypothetical protein
MNTNLGAYFMNAKDVIREVIEFGHMVTRYYISDLSDAELLVRSAPGSNHIAWQMGHMIASSQHMLKGLGHSAPDLPTGFEAAYTAETSMSDDPAKFAAKTEYLALAEQIKAASLKAVEATPESALDQPGPEQMREYAPTVASALTILGSHWLMHSGQFIPIRRKLGKKAMF